MEAEDMARLLAADLPVAGIPGGPGACQPLDSRRDETPRPFPKWCVANGRRQRPSRSELALWIVRETGKNWNGEQSRFNG